MTSDRVNLAIDRLSADGLFDSTSSRQSLLPLISLNYLAEGFRRKPREGQRGMCACLEWGAMTAMVAWHHMASFHSLLPASSLVSYKGVRAGQAGHRVQGGRVGREAEKKKGAPLTKVVRNGPVTLAASSSAAPPPQLLPQLLLFRHKIQSWSIHGLDTSGQLETWTISCSAYAVNQQSRLTLMLPGMWHIANTKVARPNG
jgi:hypothetical protein